ncbi:UNVERIFIED_CONTAM: hypothetical protein GTU68_065536 [Idotea baltica]|nr:hypothetical protein [Idotea baltica]
MRFKEVEFKGLWTALITPFNCDLKVDYKSLELLLNRQIEASVNGITLLGTTAETPTLSNDERKEILKFSKEVIGDKVPTMVGVGSYSTATTIENAKIAEELGADSLLVVTPFYNKPTQTGIIKHFEAITNTTNLPICVYNIQGRTGVNIETTTLAKIAEIDSIVGVKESSGDLGQVSDVIDSIQNTQNNFSVLSGDDALSLPLMALGGKGLVSVASNVFPKELKQLVSLCESANFKDARSLYFKLKEVFSVLFIETNPAPTKLVLNKLNIKVGSLRLPLCEVSDESAVKISEVIDNFLAKQ